MRITATQNISQISVLTSQNIDEVRISASQISTSNNITVAPLGARGYSAYEIAVSNGFVGTEQEWLASLNKIILYKVSAESIPSHTPVAIYNNLAYKLDASNPLHQFAFVGFSINGTSAGQTCEITQSGDVQLIGWGLTPNQHYMAGINGTLITNNSSSFNFTKVIGYATDSDTLQIIKDSITINK
jgi:hypothetical protein